MKIATWNLERVEPQSPRADRQKGWLWQIEADIWILTETDQAVSPGPDYGSISSDLPDYPARESERWIQIWVRDGDISPIPTSDQARTACALVSLKGGQTCLVYGTVLPWLGSAWRTYGSRDAFMAALSYQQSDWQRLMADFPDTAFILAGDFNQDLNDVPYYGSRSHKQALRQAMVDSQLVCFTCGANDPVRRVTGGQHSNIDHICVSRDRGIEFLDSFAWPGELDALKGISDHFGVGIELSLS